MRARIRNGVLAYGGFVDGSGWEGVYQVLKQDGYTVASAQNPTMSLADDDVATKRVLTAHGAVFRHGLLVGAPRGPGGRRLILAGELAYVVLHSAGGGFLKRECCGWRGR